MLEQWQDELEGFAKRLAIPTPRLIFGKVWWCPQSWPRYGAAATVNKIIIRQALQDHPGVPRRYLVGHELGHVKAKHTIRFCCVAGTACCLGYLALGWTPWPWNLKLSLVTLCLAICGHFWIIFREYEADAIAARLTSTKEVLEGMEAMRRITGRRISKEEKRRSAHLRWLEEQGQIIPYE